VNSSTKPRNQNRKPLHADWWAKTLAGLVLGFTLALALCGLFAWLGPGGIDAPQKVQFIMWMITPMWMLIFSFCYFLRSGKQALLWLLAANVIAYALLIKVRATFGAL
jgi:hypothetical protein